MPPRSRRNFVLVAGTLAAAAASLTVLLFVPPAVGLADNGDFDRVAIPAGLAPLSRAPEDRFFRWMQPRFAYVPPAADISGFRTSESLLVEGAVRAARILSDAPHFDIRFLGVLHAALLLAALGLIVAACRDLSGPAQAAAAALAVVFFTDAGYAAPFQSLYSQTASLLFLLATAAVAAEAVRRGGLRGAWLPAYFLCAAIFVTSKPQESVQAILLAPFGVLLAWAGTRRSRVRAVAIGLALALCALAFRYYTSSQASSGWLTRYNTIFREILPHSPDPRRDLAELGLDPDLARFAGVSAWVPESPARRPEVRAYLAPGSGKPSPRMFYLRHPDRLAGVLGRAAAHSFLLQPDDLGHFAKESGAPPFSRAAALWSDVRIRLSGAVFPALLLGVTLAAAGVTWRRAGPRGRLFRLGLAVLVSMAAGAFLVSALGDPGIETARHLYTFQAMCDLILLADAAWLVQSLAARRPALSAAP
jgi:hypothetical protein